MRLPTESPTGYNLVTWQGRANHQLTDESIRTDVNNRFLKKKRNKIFTSLATFGDLKSAKVWFIKPLCWMKKTNTEKIRNCTKSKLNKCKATTEMKNSSSQSSYAWTSTLEDFSAMTGTRTSFIKSGKFVFLPIQSKFRNYLVRAIILLVPLVTCLRALVLLTQILSLSMMTCRSLVLCRPVQLFRLSLSKDIQDQFSILQP